MEMTNFDSAFKLMVGIKKIKNELCLKATVIKEKHSKLDKKTLQWSYEQGNYWQ